MIFLKRFYLIFILFPLAVICATWIIIITIFQHFIQKSKITKY